MMRARLRLSARLMRAVLLGQVRARDSFVRMADIGWGTALFVAVIGAFIGMNIALQGHVTLARVGAVELLGVFVARAALREVAPIAVISFAAAKVGSEIAASLATMKDRGELDALRTSGLDPVPYVAGPWIVAMAVTLPLLVVVGDVSAAGAAQLAARYQLHVVGGSFWHGMVANSSAYDIMVGMGKGLVIGVQVAVISAVAGLRARPGIGGVSRATNRAAVFSFVSATIWNFILSQLAYGF